VREITTIAKGDDSRLVEGRRFVVRDAQSFAAVWSGHAGPENRPPPIDFDSQMVIAVFAGHRPTPGFEVEVAGTRREGNALVIMVNEREPPAGIVVAQVLVSPYHIVSLPRDDGEIRFNTPDPTGQGTVVFKAPKARTAPAPERSSVPVAPAADSSSTGLTPEVAALLAYLAGPFSGALILAMERTSGFVRFHAWQSLVALGVLGVTAVTCLVLAFALLIVSPTAFWVMLWLAAIAGVAWVVVWGLCLVQAYKGKRWKLPLAGDVAERKASTNLPASAVP
jgi:uncharacterized membrane protein